MGVPVAVLALVGVLGVVLVKKRRSKAKKAALSSQLGYTANGANSSPGAAVTLHERFMQVRNSTGEQHRIKAHH